MTDTTTIKPLIPNKVYDWMKWITIIALPAIATLLLAIGNIWNIAVLTPVAATVTAVTTLLGTLLGVSTISYNKSK